MKLTITALLCLLLWTAQLSTAAEPDLNELLSPAESVATPHTSPAPALYADFNAFNSLIRDGRIGKETARRELSGRLAAIRSDYYRRGGKNFSATEWVFPLAGYDTRAIDRGRNHGFVSSGYDYFSGNRHGGHPAYDIFIRDRNQDSRDDRSGRPVQVLSMTGGVVVALEKGWLNGSRLRGGNYIWIYDPGNSLLIYYAHNEELFIEPGTLVKPGDLLATVGRSGLNAARRRSPTHLHFSVLRITHGRPVPIPVYSELKRIEEKVHSNRKASR